MKALWSLFTIVSVIGTYYFAWQREPFWMLVCFIPQIAGFGYQIAKVFESK